MRCLKNHKNILFAKLNQKLLTILSKSVIIYQYVYAITRLLPIGGKYNEKNLSAEEKTEKHGAWLQKAYEHKEWQTRT